MGDPRQLLERMLTDCLGKFTLVESFSWQMGGDINRAASVSTSKHPYFIKWNEAQYAHMFEVEARGLELLAHACPLKIPAVIGTGTVDGQAFLVLEQLEKGFQSNEYWQNLGEGLAALHLEKRKTFGLDHDNYIGRLAQGNAATTGWLDFFATQRLEAQLKLAVENAYLSRSFVDQFTAFLEKLPHIMPDSAPALLHGDLWSGNAMAVAGNRASIYDPAVYQGAREVDLAMTRLFGGFDRQFYEAYDAVYPIPAHFEDLVDVYNLYPLMVHVNLFGPGSGYARSVNKIIGRYS